MRGGARLIPVSRIATDLSLPPPSMRPLGPDGGQEAGRYFPRVLGHAAIEFFQAEDGIRDLAGTGVQTCALPISRTASDSVGCAWTVIPTSSLVPRNSMASRSEERRVGKSVDLGGRRIIKKK